MLELAAIFITLTALLAYLNRRFIGLPPAIGVMAIALGLSLLALGLDAAGASALRDYEAALLHSVNFSELLMQGMLSLLLFAGALHVDLGELRRYRWTVGLLAGLGTVASAVLIGTLMSLLLPLMGLQLPFAYCLLFGALISPTDPIAVMGIMKSAGAPRNVELVIAGESLFNDGVGVVLFVFVLMLATQATPPTFADGALLLLREAGGGALLGAVIGLVGYTLLKSIDSYQEEVLLTLAAVIGGYALAHRLHVSGPLAMVVAGLVIGNQGRALAMSDQTRHHVDTFWELIDEILNAVLFVLLGLEIIVLRISPATVGAGLLAALVTLSARALTVGAPVRLLHRRLDLPPQSWKLLTWGGLRGGISVALALSLPLGAERDLITAMTYVVVILSVLIQGLSVGPLTRRTLPCRPPQT